MSFSLRSCATGLVLAAALVPTAGFAADPQNGASLAHRWCEACHVIGYVPRQIGVAGAQVFELDLRASDALDHARNIARVVVPFGPKIVVSDGNRNATTWP